MKRTLSEADFITASYAIAEFIKFIFTVSSCCLESFIKCLDGWKPDLHLHNRYMSYSTHFGFLLVTLPLPCIFDCVLASNGKNKTEIIFLRSKKKGTAVQIEAKINSSFHSCLQLTVNLYIIP